MPLRQCLEPGCYALIEGESRCPIHNELQLEITGSSQWRAYSKADRRRKPLCDMCLAQGKVVVGTHTHHVEPRTHNNPLLPASTHQTVPLCVSHHSSITRNEQRMMMSDLSSSQVSRSSYVLPSSGSGGVGAGRSASGVSP